MTVKILFPLLCTYILVEITNFHRFLRYYSFFLVHNTLMFLGDIVNDNIIKRLGVKVTFFCLLVRIEWSKQTNVCRNTYSYHRLSSISYLRFKVKREKVVREKK